MSSKPLPSSLQQRSGQALKCRRTMTNHTLSLPTSTGISISTNKEYYEPESLSEFKENQTVTWIAGQGSTRHRTRGLILWIENGRARIELPWAQRGTVGFTRVWKKLGDLEIVKDDTLSSDDGN